MLFPPWYKVKGKQEKHCMNEAIGEVITEPFNKVILC